MKDAKRISSIGFLILSLVVLVIGLKNFLYAQSFACSTYFSDCTEGGCTGIDIIAQDCAIVGCNLPPGYAVCKKPKG